MKPFLIAINVLVVIAVACQTPAEVKNNNTQIVEVFKGSQDVNPQKRKLTKIGRLNGAGVEALQRYAGSAERKTLSFVISTYYLDLLDETGKLKKRYGVVVGSNGQLLGLDVTTADPSKTYATAPHSVLVTEDAEAAKALLESIKEVEATHGKTSE